MTNTAAVIATISELCALPEFASVTDADGRTLTKKCSGKPTSNPNWICWEAEGVRLHSEDVALPATVA